jgi:hypothetical protein
MASGDSDLPWRVQNKGISGLVPRSASQSRSARDGGRPEGRIALFPALAEAVDIRFPVEVNVAAGQLGEFGDAQAGTQREQEQRAVAPAGPGLPVGCV